ncbi:MAG TPA: DUF2298 domain-containing protein, partial [Roseiflexaceae bacterium]
SVVGRRVERRAIATGIVAAVFVVLAGNLANAVWFMPGSASPPDPREPAQCQLGSYAAKEACKGRKEWVFWDATRVISISLSNPEHNDGTISEFPYFTFLYGDLHAHMIALPLALAALGLIVALVRIEDPPEDTRPRTAGWRRFGSWFLVLGSMSLVVGALRATNTWDYPTYLGLGVLTLALAAWDRWRRGMRWAAAAGRWVLAALGLTLLSTLLFLPFTRTFATDYAGFELWRGDHTLAIDFLKINGLWLFLLASAALALYQRIYRISYWRMAVIAAAILLMAGAVALHMAALTLLVPLAGASIGLAFDMLSGGQRRPTTEEGPRIAQSVPDQELGTDDGEEPDLAPRAARPVPLIPGPRLLVPGSRPHASRVSLTTLLPVLWGISAIWLTLLVELIVAKGDIGRMNTVFKLGMQSWVLFAMASAVALTWLWGESKVRLTTARRRLGEYAAGESKVRSYMGWAWRGMAALLFAAALVYPLTATPVRLADRYDPGIGMTLDGTAYMRSANATWAENGKQFSLAADADALDWMREHIRGTPIVLEAQTEAYRWGGRVSIYTGLPTLLGWPGHENQQRAVAMVSPVLDSRRTLVTQLYNTTSPSETLQTLKLYGVEYIYVGEL